MMAPRRGTRRGLGRRKRPGSRLDELTERTRQEARTISRKQRAEARRALRTQAETFEDLGAKLKGARQKSRRRLHPVLAPAGLVISWAAPRISAAILFVVKLVGALVVLVLELGQLAISRIGRLLGVASVTTAHWLRVNVTPRATYAAVGACAALALAGAQFANYHGVAVDVPNYAGEVGVVAPPPMTGTASAGSAHLWVLLPVALVALVLIALTYAGRAKLAAAISACGVVGLGVAIGVDLPQGLDAGREGIAFYGAKAVLLGGFWVEVASSAVLVLCGVLLAPRFPAARGARRPTGGGRRSGAPEAELGGISRGLQAES